MHVIKAAAPAAPAAAQESFTEGDLRNLSQQLLEAVSFCHECHVAHRDVKPENVMVREAVRGHTHTHTM